MYPKFTTQIQPSVLGNGWTKFHDNSKQKLKTIVETQRFARYKRTEKTARINQTNNHDEKVVPIRYQEVERVRERERLTRFRDISIETERETEREEKRNF